MMSKNDLINKLNKCKLSDNFTLLDSELSADIYVGYYHGNMSFAVDGSCDNFEVKSTDVIEIDLFEVGNPKKNRLTFELKKPEFEEVFINLIYDIYGYLTEIKQKNLLRNSYKRWLLWKTLFKQVSEAHLSNIEIQGLLAELVFLKNHMLKRHSNFESIDAWGGSEFMKKDFLIDNEWFEVKSIIMGNDSVKISSIEQLDSEIEGNLVVVSLERTTPVDNNGVNLNIIVEKISSLLDDIEVIEKFYDKLANIGYKRIPYYDDYNYLVKKINSYIVNKSFPKLSKECIPKGIKGVSYEIAISTINDYMRDLKIVTKI